MTPKEALNVLVNDIQVDCKWTTNFERDYECLEMCKQALEKQIPKKPKKYTTSFPSCGMVSECPVCGLQFGFNRGFNFCEDCGQAIDWTEDNK